MKYKLLALAVLLILLTTALAVASINDGLLPRYIQHEEAQDENGVQQTGVLPVVCIETEGGALPIILSNGSEEEGTLLQTSTVVSAQVRVYAGDGEGGWEESQLLTENSATLRYRGHSSMRFDKKQYKLCFVDAQGQEDKSVAFLGMEPHDEWALNAPYLDRSLLRNYLCYNVAGQVLPYTPDTRYCELYLNGVYQGLYLGLETVARGGGRVKIPSYQQGNNALAYIVREDWASGTERLVNNLATYAMLYGSESNLETIYPGQETLTDAYQERIARDMSQFEKALYSYDYDKLTLGYRRYIDVQSFVDYFIINEFFQNIDAGRYSTYFYRDGKSKLCIGPVWDFNSALGYYEADISAGGFVMCTKPYFNMLVKDEAFVARVIARYRQLRKTVLSDAYLQAFVDDAAAYIAPAAARNNELWGDSMYGDNIQAEIRLEPEERNPQDYAYAVGQVRGFIKQRGEYLDAYIDSLWHYCHESAVKKYNP